MQSPPNKNFTNKAGGESRNLGTRYSHGVGHEMPPNVFLFSDLLHVSQLSSNVYRTTWSGNEGLAESRLGPKDGGQGQSHLKVRSHEPNREAIVSKLTLRRSLTRP